MIARPPISNEGWDAGRMLAQALRGAYPSAEYGSRHRDDELAYWRLRAEADGADVAAIERAYEQETRAHARRGRR